MDDAPEQNIIDSATTVTLSDPSDRRRDRGNSLTDRRHVLNLTGVFTPQFHGSSKLARYLLNLNRLSIAMVATSGDVFNIGSNRILNGDNSEAAANQRPLFVGRNTVRGPAIFELNARYSRLFPVSEHKTFEFIAESTNVTNALNVTNLNTTPWWTPSEISSCRHATRRPRLATSVLSNWACGSIFDRKGRSAMSGERQFWKFREFLTPSANALPAFRSSLLNCKRY
jgi:hypothetical protein